jgi:peptidoglycan hydrolase CwlO-like protein
MADEGAQTILEKLDKQNSINMNYQNENDNGFNTVQADLKEVKAQLDKLTEMLSAFQGENDNSFTDILNWINKDK